MIFRAYRQRKYKRSGSCVIDGYVLLSLKEKRFVNTAERDILREKIVMKNYVNEDQKLPMFGIGPYLVAAMGLLTVIGILLSGNILGSGVLTGIWIGIFRIFGILFIVLGISVWFIGAMHSDMDQSITENKLQTSGIYSWVRNPMYSGWWQAMFGISLFSHNAWLLFIPVINWCIMTIVLINTEEKWLLDLYGQEYEQYKRRVNRCIPCPPRNRGEKRS